jgi:hypothetical protein
MKITRKAASYDLCRTYGHAWFEQDADRPAPFGFYMWVQCERCDTIRKDIVTRWGGVLSRSYEYPDDYRDSEGHTREDYRARLLAPRVPEPVGREEKNIEKLKEQLRLARARQKTMVIETTATEDARPSGSAPARRPAKKAAVAVRRRVAA